MKIMNSKNSSGGSVATFVLDELPDFTMDLAKKRIRMQGSALDEVIIDFAGSDASSITADRLSAVQDLAEDHGIKLEATNFTGENPFHITTLPPVP